jgi:hypothetical protein
MKNTIEYSSKVARLLGKGAVLLAGLVALGTTSACSAPAEGDADVDTRGDALVGLYDPWEFKSFGLVPALSTGQGDPAMCTPNGSHSKVIFTRDTSNFIQGQADVIGINGAWGKYGGSGANRKFGGRPACGFLAGSSSPYPFLLFAKSATTASGASDKRLYWSKGEWTVNGSAPAPTTALTQWAAVDGTQYSTNGNPTVATNSGSLVVAYLTDAGQLRANYWVSATSTLSPTISAPNLPAGWTGQGSPAIVYVGTWVGKYTVLVRATNSSGTVRLYKTFFDGTQFVSAAGGAATSLEQVTLPGGTPVIQSDPALEWDSNLGAATLYFRNGTGLYQMSSSDIYFNASTVKQVTTGSTKAVSGNPVVIGGVPYEQGRHWILIRGSGADKNLYFVESLNDENLGVNPVPTVKASPDPLVFPNATVGAGACGAQGATSCTYATATLTNTTTVAQHISSASASSVFWVTWGGTCNSLALSKTIPPGGSCTLQFGFHPTAAHTTSTGIGSVTFDSGIVPTFQLRGTSN